MKKILLLTVGVLFMVSCASTGANLQRATATSIGKNTLSGDYTVSNIKRGATSVSWKAKNKDGKCYSCEADDMVRKVNCAEVSCDE